MFLDDVNIGGQLKIGTGVVPAVGEGCPTEQGPKVNGSLYCEGRTVFGDNLHSLIHMPQYA